MNVSQFDQKRSTLNKTILQIELIVMPIAPMTLFHVVQTDCENLECLLSYTKLKMYENKPAIARRHGKR